MRTFILFLFISSHLTHAQSDFVDSYGIITTIAGTGTIAKKGENGWKSSFEKKPGNKAELSRPHFAMANEDGDIYIADKDAHAIRRIDAKTKKITTVAGTNKMGFDGDGPAKRKMLNKPNGLYVLKNGTVYILDLGNNRIRKIDNEGNLTTVVKDSQGISLGRGLWVSEAEDSVIYASGKKLKIWTTTTPLRTYADGFVQLGNICMDAKGNLIVTDRGSGRVFRLNNATEKPEHIAGNGLTSSGKDKSNPLKRSLEGVRAVWPTPDGGLLLGCHESHDIYYLSPDYKIMKFINGGRDVHEGDGTDIKKGQKISETRSITMDSKGNIIICEHDAGFIRLVEKK